MGCATGEHFARYLADQGRAKRREAAWRLLPFQRGAEMCEQPKVMECGRCGELFEIACGISMASRCVPCSKRYRRRWSRVLRSGSIDTDSQRVFFVTLTAPGDSEHVDTRTTQMCECTPPEGVDPAVWNALLAKNWSAFTVYLRRRFGDVQYAKAVEVQMKRLRRTGRGLLHLHVLIRCDADLTQHKEELRQLAMRWGFGHSIDVEPFHPRHVHYLANYGTKACDDRQHIDLLDLRTGEIVHGPRRMRTFSCSRNYGDTIVQVKQQQRGWVLAKLAEQDAEREARDAAAARERTTDREAPASGPPAAPDNAAGPDPSLDPYTASSTTPPAQGTLFAM